MGGHKSIRGSSYPAPAPPPAWVSPTSHNDPSLQWEEPEWSYDKNLITRARITVPKEETKPYLELLHAALNCDRIKEYISAQNEEFITYDIDVYYEGTWHNLVTNGNTFNAEIEYALLSTKSVTATRRRFRNSSDADDYLAYVNESYFREVYE